MNFAASAPTVDAANDPVNEIAALVRQLDQIQGRIQELAGGELDAVLHSGGRSYLLHEAQERLRESENLYRALFENMLEGCCYCRLLHDGDQPVDFIHLRVNRAFEALTGLMDVVGKKVSEAMPGLLESNPEMLAHFGRVAASGQPEQFETYIETLGLWLSLSAYSDKAGYFAVVFEDITERKKAAEKLQANEIFFRLFVRDTPAAIAMLDAEMRYIHVSERWMQDYHLDDRNLIGRSIYDKFPDAPPRWREIHQSVLAGSVERCDEDPFPRVDGAMDWLQWEVRPWRQMGGEIGGVIIFTQVVTERKKLEEQFLRAQRMEGIGTLAGGIAHDLNNMLAPILMSIELLKLKMEDPSSQKLLSTIDSCARRGADMVAQVLSFARGVEGRRMVVQVKHLLRDLAKLASDTFPKSIQVRSIEPHDLWTVLGDPTQLHQALLNLCVNARDAMPKGGSLTLSGENIAIDKHYAALNLDANVGPYVVLEVEDTGGGIPAAVVEKIFDPYFTTKEFGKGTGLGLSTMLAIVKSHGGFVRVHSKPGKGARFKIYLPASMESSAAAVAVAETEMPRGDGELILVVDDELSVREIAMQTLEAFGYRVVLAAEGSEALAIYASRAKDIALVLTDMMMPVMDGPAMIQVLLKLNPSVKIIAASGFIANGRLSDSGIKHFLSKPYTAETLLKTLKRALTDVSL